MFLFISLLACSDKSDDSGNDGYDFVGMDFALESAEGYELVAEEARIAFASDREFSFSAGCNGLGGNLLCTR